jgi:hypothetical protein
MNPLGPRHIALGDVDRHAHRAVSAGVCLNLPIPAVDLAHTSPADVGIDRRSNIGLTCTFTALRLSPSPQLRHDPGSEFVRDLRDRPRQGRDNDLHIGDGAHRLASAHVHPTARAMPNLAGVTFHHTVNRCQSGRGREFDHPGG